MPALPAAFIHVMGLLRPRLLRPDIRVPSIAQIDFAGLRKAGFNAVVVDKDNCVTLPHADTIYPPYASAWTSLLHTFPGRVLVVSNSAGSKKDRGGIGAESLSLSLRAPVLAHRHSKPACTREILDFFAGRTQPHTLRSRGLAPVAAAQRAETDAEKELLDAWRGQVDHGPLCGPLGGAGTLEQRMLAAERDRRPKSAPVTAASPSHVERRMVAAEREGKPESVPETPVPPPKNEPQTPVPTSEPLRILVIGDRLFTDSLQARELDAPLAASPSPATLMIQTTDLPQPNDLRLMRRFETWLSGGGLAHGGHAGGVDWSQYAIIPPPPPPPPRWIDVQLARLNPVTALDDGGPAITWDPRSWRPRPVAAAILSALGTATAFVSRHFARAVKIASVWGWRSMREWSSRQWAAFKVHRAARAEERQRLRVEREAQEEKEAVHGAVDKVKSA